MAHHVTKSLINHLIHLFFLNNSPLRSGFYFCHSVYLFFTFSLYTFLFSFGLLLSILLFFSREAIKPSLISKMHPICAQPK
jgi:hypothetical protein